MAISQPEIRNWTIYKITSPSGRVYIGKTSNYKQRIRHYKSYLGFGQRLIKRSLMKYGFDNHIFEKIESFYGTNEYCEGKEMFWIRSYMSNKNKYRNGNGLNLTNGGDGSFGAKKSEKEKEKMRLRNIGKKHTQEWRDKMANIMKGNKYALGVKLSKETKLKMSSSRRGIVFSEEKKLKYLSAVKMRSKRIYQTDEVGNILQTFHSIADAQRKLSVNNISLVLSGKLGKTKGLYFKLA